MNPVEALGVSHWQPPSSGDGAAVAAALESGKVLHLPHLSFRLSPEEHRFLDRRWSDGRAKNISYDPRAGSLRGAIGNRSDLEELQRLISRFHAQAIGLVECLLPHYAGRLRGARTSFRPLPVAGRAASWRKDDSRLHVDAFPSRPNHGERILRVFANVNPHGRPRTWRVGEPFEDVAARFWKKLRRPLPGAAAVLGALGVTKGRRSHYDHYMLQLHDAMKRDLHYQRTATQTRLDFAPGAAWICFSDRVSHAAMDGQHLLEQTLHLPVEAMYDPSRSPLRILEGLAGRPLV